jgi:uncharacterized protein (TIGR03083 family)
MALRRSRDLRTVSVVIGLDHDLWIERESEAFAALLDDAVLDRRVPGCPEWTLRELAWHLGRVQQGWASVVRAGADIEPKFPERVPGPRDAGPLQRWMRASTRALLDALRVTPPDMSAWVWWHEDRTVGAIARHQVQEVAVHRWDARSCLGPPSVLEQAVADDGVDEFVWIALQMRAPAPIVFVAIDSGRSTPASTEPATTTVSATASDLVLLLHGRISPSQVHVDGDRAALDAFLRPVE